MNHLCYRRKVYFHFVTVFSLPKFPVRKSAIRRTKTFLALTSYAVSIQDRYCNELQVPDLTLSRFLRNSWNDTVLAVLYRRALRAVGNHSAIPQHVYPHLTEAFVYNVYAQQAMPFISARSISTLTTRSHYLPLAVAGRSSSVERQRSQFIAGHICSRNCRRRVSHEFAAHLFILC